MGLGWGVGKFISVWGFVKYRRHTKPGLVAPESSVILPPATTCRTVTCNNSAPGSQAPLTILLYLLRAPNQEKCAAGHLRKGR